MRIRISRVLACATALGLGLSAVSCGGGGGGGASDLVLVGFNLPNIAGVALNQPLIFTFSDDVDPFTVTPDTVQVVGTPSFTFETTVVDGNLAALLPFIPNFKDYSDSGLAPNTMYSVFLPIFPAVDTVRSTRGRPLVQAESYTFTTVPTNTFIEPRRPLVHEPLAAKGDEEGCLQNSAFEPPLYTGAFQSGTSASARLLCLENEGPPHIVLDDCIPTHDQRAVGTPSAVSAGFLDLPAVRVRFNEPLDPVTVYPYIPVTKRSLNVQLWRVGDIDGNPIGSPTQVPTNEPLLVQDLGQTEAILVASGAQPQGTYLVNIQGVRDLPGNALVISDSPNPALGGYSAIDASLTGTVPPGYRIYFRTLQLPPTSGAISESFGGNFNEQTTQLFTKSTPATDPDTALAFPLTATQAEPLQATTANWNNAYRFLGFPNLLVNDSQDNGAGRLKAVFEPYLGNGADGSFNLPNGSSTLSSDSGSLNNDGVYEFTDFYLGPTATLNLTGSKPVLILVHGTCTIEGTIQSNGADGRFGIDTDGTATYQNALGIAASGVGGAGGAGAGSGGRGAPGLLVGSEGLAVAGSGGANLFGDGSSGGGTPGSADTGTGGTKGGGGGGYAASGGNGSGTGLGGTGGPSVGAADFARGLGQFSPQRCYQPNANIQGGSGGGGGGLEDDTNATETADGTVTLVNGDKIASGDDAGGGGGGGGGALWLIAKSISIASSGKILCRGGRGGNTYGPTDQIVVDPDNMTANDEYIGGVVDANAAGTGQGGGGGGGSGGAILLQARDALTIAGSAQLDCTGGVGGTTASNTSNGGTGSVGRIGLMVMAATTDVGGSAGSFSNAGTVTPAAGVSGAIWKPTVDVTSAGIPVWTDVIGTNATFQAPFWVDNFPFLSGVQGVDYDAVLELQGALTVDSTTASTTATGLTAWLPAASFASLNNLQFIRWRWKFYVKRDYDQLNQAMPAILDFTLPFQK